MENWRESENPDDNTDAMNTIAANAAIHMEFNKLLEEPDRRLQLTKGLKKVNHLGALVSGSTTRRRLSTKSVNEIFRMIFSVQEKKKRKRKSAPSIDE